MSMQLVVSTEVVGILMLALCSAALSAETTKPDAKEPPIRRSDVVFMGNKGVEVTKAYGGTVVSWGGRPWTDNKKALDGHHKRVQAIRALGVRYCPGAAFRTAFKGMIDFAPKDFMDSVCRRLDGKPILVPWLWDHKHKDGHPAYWFCTNAPGYRTYLKHQVKLCMSTPAEGLHIDDYAGTAGTEWRGGCFCRHCMAAFRDTLKTQVPAQRLKACGVASLDGFDYGQFLRDKGVTTDKYRRTISSLPLGPEFLTFLYRSSAAFVGEVRRYAEELQGHRLMLSVNSSAVHFKSLVIAPQLDYFCGEVHHGGDRGGVPAPFAIWNFKIVDALGKRQVSTGSGGDWAYIDAHKKPGLVRTWIAQDYAFGHQLMCPHRQWAYTKDKGTHHYQSRPADFAHIYRWIRRNAALFDGHEAAATVALLYSNPAFRRNRQGARDAAYWLAQHNVPFHVVIAGDDWLDVTLTAEQLARYAAVVVAEPTHLDGEQLAALQAAKARIVAWDTRKKAIDAKRLFGLVPRQIAIAGADRIMAVPRTKPGAPPVLHLLNRNYDREKDAVLPATDLTVTLASSLFAGNTFAKATLYSPPATLDPANPGASDPVPLDVKTDAESTTLRIPRLALWAIVKLGE